MEGPQHTPLIWRRPSVPYPIVVLALALTCVSAQPQADYEETVRRADALVRAGDFFEAVRVYERAARIAYNSKLATDTRALDEKLAAARKARDEKAKSAAPAPASPAPAAKASFVELTTRLADGPRIVSSRNVPSDQRFGPLDTQSRWNVTNPYLPVDRYFLSKMYTMTCAPDGSLYLGAEGVVSAADTGWPPTTNRGWYADNGRGIWRVMPDGAVTTFSVRPRGNQPGAFHDTAKCNAPIADAGVAPEHWGGMAIDPAGNIVVSDFELHLILRFRPDGMVEHVAGGGADACAYDRWKTLQKPGYLDGPGGQALFNGPRGLAFDRDGNLLVADSGNCALRRIDRNRNVTTVHKGCASDPAHPADESSRITYDRVALDRDGNPVIGGNRILLGMEIYGNIFRFLPDGRAEQLLAARRLRPNSPRQELGLLMDLTYPPGGALLLSDGFQEGSRLYEVRNGLLFNVAGLGGDDTLESDVDGPAAKARIRQPGAICASADGTLFVLPRNRGRALRKIDARSRMVNTWVY